MARSTIRVTGVDSAIRKLGILADLDRKAVVKAVAKTTTEVADDMRTNAAVGDGRRKRDRGRPPLADSIEEHADDLSGEARATAPHAHLVEDGTSTHRAQPFARPAAERARARFPKNVQEAMLDAHRDVT